jgi:hypothetical protein
MLLLNTNLRRCHPGGLPEPHEALVTGTLRQQHHRKDSASSGQLPNVGHLRAASRRLLGLSGTGGAGPTTIW